ncbi:MAG: hypothetical protein JWQ62_748 [Lacunisphaera sp.]|nr:hypothetical protein [Lacunisphaera sp.]
MSGLIAEPGAAGEIIFVSPAAPRSIRRVPPPSRSKWLVVALALGVPLAFALFTNHAWEDYYITLRSSRNLVAGNGLVFNPGERLHTFTSPLGVLVPALCTAVTGTDHESAALWLFRIINVVFLAAAALLVWRRIEALGWTAPARLLFFGLLLADAKLVDFSINGMETALMVYFVLLLWSELESPAGPKPSRLAAAYGGLMWTRPDAFILAGLLTVTHFLFRGREARRLPVSWPVLLRGALIGGLLYAPWFAWAWWYYGSPVPHTILAKSAITPPASIPYLLLLPIRELLGRSSLVNLFLPTYWMFGGWPRLLQYFAQILTVVSLFGWVLPGLAPLARRASLTLFLGGFYLCAIIMFPWYVPPWSILAYLTLAQMVDQAGRHAMVAARPIFHTGLRVGCAVAVLLQAGMLAGTAWQMRNHQHYVEDQVRHEIGDWLRRHSAPGETVFLEPLGYIGYFSRMKTYDYPGLSSREVTAAIKAGNTSYTALIDRLHPDWIVLRPAELGRPEFQVNPILERDYQVVKEWNATPQLDAVRVLPGRAWVEFEAHYYLFKRNSSAGGRIPAPNVRKPAP